MPQVEFILFDILVIKVVFEVGEFLLGDLEGVDFFLDCLELLDAAADLLTTRHLVGEHMYIGLEVKMTCLFDIEQGIDFCLEVPCFSFMQGYYFLVLDRGRAHGGYGAFYAFGGLDDT